MKKFSDQKRTRLYIHNAYEIRHYVYKEQSIFIGRRWRTGNQHRINGRLICRAHRIRRTRLRGIKMGSGFIYKVSPISIVIQVIH